MRKYFQVIEKCGYLDFNDSRDGHGFNGWLSVNRPAATLALGDAKIVKILTAAAFAFVRSAGKFFGTTKELTGALREEPRPGAWRSDVTMRMIS